MVLFLQKNAIFLRKNAGISKTEKALVLKVIFSETKYVCVLTGALSGLKQFLANESPLKR